MVSTNTLRLISSNSFVPLLQSWMSRSHCDFPGHLQPAADTPELVSLATEGARHEQRVLARLQADTDDVWTIPVAANRAALTRHAMKAGHVVIYHGTLTSDDFLGMADFFVRVESPSTLGSYSYEIWDAKLARNARPEFVLQLCCYADLLAAVQGRYPEQVQLLLNDGIPKAFRTDDYFYYYRHLKAAFLAWMRAFSPDSPPLPEVGGAWDEENFLKQRAGSDPVFVPLCAAGQRARDV
jgi:predicted RecB family nuclease